MLLWCLQSMGIRNETRTYVSSWANSMGMISCIFYLSRKVPKSTEPWTLAPFQTTTPFAHQLKFNDLTGSHQAKLKMETPRII